MLTWQEHLARRDRHPVEVGGEQDVAVAGGGRVVQQLLDDMQLLIAQQDLSWAQVRQWERTQWSRPGPVAAADW